MRVTIDRVGDARTLADLDGRIVTCRACPRLVAWPEEVGRYEALFASRAYLPASLGTPITEPVRRAAAHTARRRRQPHPRREPAQLALAV